MTFAEKAALAEATEAVRLLTKLVTDLTNRVKDLEEAATKPPEKRRG